MKVAIAQLNPIVGDVYGNVSMLESAIERVAGEEPALIVFSELFLTGYPPRDLLEREDFLKIVEKNIERVKDISRKFSGIAILVGSVVRSSSRFGKGLHNSGLLFLDGKLIFSQAKSLLPYYDVFDETRYFDPASIRKPVEFRGEVLGITICEDAWNDPKMWKKRPYSLDPIEELAKKGVTLFINISASPFSIGKEKVRFELIKNHIARWHVPFIFVNQVGGNDELVFDGTSFFLDADGRPVTVLPSFDEGLVVVDTENKGTDSIWKEMGRVESIFLALTKGLKDYVRKCGFEKVVLGLSGGIDSAVSACIATYALGPQNVIGVTLPSPFSSRGSVEDSRRLAMNLGIEFKEIPITSIYKEYIRMIRDEIGIKEGEVTIPMENIQARIRGNILMALSNQYGYLLLSSGNKSEFAVGYCTLYGDMTGGLAIISDIPKTTVYELAEYINREKEVIPEVIIKKKPSAELKEGQLDEDTLPPYEVLDPILHYYLEEGWSEKELVEKGFDEGTVRWVIEAVKKNEYKRRQAPPCIKVTTKAFGMGRRMPIAARY